MESSDFNDISYQKDEQGIVTLTFDTPRRKNALSGVTFVELYWAIDHFERDETAHVMIMTGAKDPQSDDPAKEAFSSGGYFNPDAFEGVSEEVLAQVDSKDIAQKRTTLKLFQCDKPVIAAVNGLAIGGALTLILSGADQIYVSEHAWGQLPFAKLGISPELASSFLLPRLLGMQKAKQILLFGERMTAQELVELGLANRVLPHDELLPYARERALQLAPPQAPGLAIREIKKLVNSAQLDAVSAALDRENDALHTLMRSADFVEGLTARAERRSPTFSGK